MTERREHDPAHPEYTEFHRASTPMEANLVCNLLRSSGIPAHVEGGMLVDEFAISQRLMNAQEVRVFVRADQVQKAREILDAARLTASELEEQAMASAPEQVDERTVESSLRTHARRSPLVPGLAILFAILTVVFASLWLRALRNLEGEDPLWVANLEHDGVRWRWRTNGCDALRMYDRNANRLFEEHRFFDPNGRLVSVSLDADENAMFERVRELRADGTQWEWTDEDGDGGWDLCEVRDTDGALLIALRYAGKDGVTVVR